MLSENIKTLRKKKGLSQDELAIKINVVRQTVSKWEKGLSVPDSEMIIKLAEELDTTVNVLLGETIELHETTELEALAAKLELLNEQFSRQNENRRRILRIIFTTICIVSIICIAKYLIGDIYHILLMNEINEAVSIIGGIDGPTAIAVSGYNLKIGRILICAVIAIASFIGIYKTQRR